MAHIIYYVIYVSHDIRLTFELRMVVWYDEQKNKKLSQKSHNIAEIVTFYTSSTEQTVQHNLLP